MDRIRVGIFGASGYTGYELIKLLANHERAEVVLATSQSYAGQRISDLYPCPPALGGRGKRFRPAPDRRERGVGREHASV